MSEATPVDVSTGPVVQPSDPVDVIESNVADEVEDAKETESDFRERLEERVNRIESALGDIIRYHEHRGSADPSLVGGGPTA